MSTSLHQARPLTGRVRRTEVALCAEDAKIMICRSTMSESFMGACRVDMHQQCNNLLDQTIRVAYGQDKTKIQLSQNQWHGPHGSMAELTDLTSAL